MGSLWPLLGMLAALGAPAVARAQDMEAVRASLAVGDREDARQQLVSLTAAGVSDGDAYLYLGAMLREEGQLDAAVSTFRAGLEQDPTHLDMRAEMAMTLAWQQAFNVAIAEYDRVLAQDPEHRAARLGRARVLAWAGRHEEAETVYRRALARDPDDLEALRGAAMVDRVRLRHREARSKYQHVLSLDSDDPEAIDGLRALEEDSRATAEAGGGVAYYQGADTIASFFAELSYRVTPEVTPYARYQNDAAAGALGSVTGSDSAPWAHQVEAGLRLSPRPRWAAGAGYILNVREGATKHQWPVRLSRELPRGWVALGGLRPGYGGDARRELLSDAGLQWATGPHWLMGQVFQYVSAAGDLGWTLVGTGFARPMPRLGLKAGGGYGTDNGEPKRLAFGEVSVRMGRGELVAFYEYIRTGFVRHAPQLRVRVYL